MTAARTTSAVDPSTENRMSGLYLLLAVIVFFAGAGAIWFGVKTHTITRTHVVKVEKSYGKPDSVVDGAQVNPQLAGLKCSVYSSRKTIVCQP